MAAILRSVGLLFVSNIFMTYAWYGHLKTLRDKPVWIAIVASWGVALLEYCFQVPANRMGYGALSLAQLKVIQEVITMAVFACFAVWYMGVPVSRNLVWAGMCLVGAAYFIFRDGVGR